MYIYDPWASLWLNWRWNCIMEPVELLLNMAAATMTERTTLIYVRWRGGRGLERERERGGASPTRLPACLPHPLSASFFIYCSLLGCVNLDASGWSDSECTASSPHSLLLYPAAAFLLCLGLAWLGPNRLSDTVAAAVGDNWNYGFYVS